MLTKTVRRLVIMSKQNEGTKTNEGKEKERVCYWEVADVESNGDIIVRVFNESKQNELNALAGRAKARHTKAYNKVREQEIGRAHV